MYKITRIRRKENVALALKITEESTGDDDENLRIA